MQVFFFLWKSCRYSTSCGRSAAILLPILRSASNFLPIGKLEVVSFINESSWYSSSCRRFEELYGFFSCRRFSGILLPVKELQLFFFLWKSCRYSSSYGRAASIFLPIGELHIIFFLKESWRYFLHIGELYVFSFIWNICRYSCSRGRATAILLPIKELQVFFFLWESCSSSSCYGRSAGKFLPMGKLEVVSFI